MFCFRNGGLNGSFLCFLNVCIYILVNRSKFEKKKQRSLEPTLGKENIQADSEV